jgi:hypothetical protein
MEGGRTADLYSAKINESNITRKPPVINNARRTPFPRLLFLCVFLFSGGLFPDPGADPCPDDRLPEAEASFVLLKPIFYDHSQVSPVPNSGSNISIIVFF